MVTTTPPTSWQSPDQTPRRPAAPPMLQETWPLGMKVLEARARWKHSQDQDSLKPPKESWSKTLLQQRSYSVLSILLATAACLRLGSNQVPFPLFTWLWMSMLVLWGEYDRLYYLECILRRNGMNEAIHVPHLLLKFSLYGNLKSLPNKPQTPRFFLLIG